MENPARESLFDAIRSGDPDRVWASIRAGADVEEWENDQQPLGEAARIGHAEIVRMLLDAGANPDRGGLSVPLNVAATEGHIEIVWMLIRAGAMVDQHDDASDTALMCAAAMGHLDLVKLLVGVGADVNATDEMGQTALDVAELKGRRQIADYLARLIKPPFGPLGP